MDRTLATFTGDIGFTATVCKAGSNCGCCVVLENDITHKAWTLGGKTKEEAIADAKAWVSGLKPLPTSATLRSHSKANAVVAAYSRLQYGRCRRDP
jgi:hypothetical protein